MADDYNPDVFTLTVDGIEPAESYYGGETPCYECLPDGSVLVHGSDEFLRLLTEKTDGGWAMPDVRISGHRYRQFKPHAGSVFMAPVDDSRSRVEPVQLLKSSKVIDWSGDGGDAVCLQLGWQNLDWWWGDDWDDVGATDIVSPEFQCGALLLSFPWTAVVKRPTDDDRNDGFDMRWSKEDLSKRRAPIVVAAPRDLGYGVDRSSMRFMDSSDHKLTATASGADVVTVDGPHDPFSSLAGSDSASVFKVHMGDSVADVIARHRCFLVDYCGLNETAAAHMAMVTTSKLG